MTISSDELRGQLERLHRMSAQDLSQFEKVIAKDFRDLASKYLRARLVRARAIQAQLESLLKSTTLSETSWNRIVGFELKTISSLSSTAEDLIRKRPGALSSLQEYDDELTAVCRSLEGPLNFDSSIANPKENSVPFCEKLNKVLDPHVIRLRLIASERNYQARLVAQLARANSEVAWNQYYTDVVARKHKLIEETERQLAALDTEYDRPRRRRHWFKPLARTRRSIASQKLKPKTGGIVLDQTLCLSQKEAEDDIELIRAQIQSSGSDKDSDAIKHELKPTGSCLPEGLDHSVSLPDVSSSMDDSALELDALDVHLLDMENDASLLEDIEPCSTSESQLSPRSRYQQMLYSHDNLYGPRLRFQLPLFPSLGE